MRKKIGIRYIRKNNHAKQYKHPIYAQWILTNIKLKEFTMKLKLNIYKQQSPRA